MKKSTFPSDLSSKGISLLKKFSRMSVMVAGDFVVDEGIYGESERISREAPVIILRYSHTVFAPGGAGNAVNNILDLGAQVYPLGVVGEDDPGSKLIHYFKTKKIDVSGLVTVKNRHTTVKCRIMAGAQHSAKQQVIRIDRLDEKDISRQVEAKLIGRITALAPKVDVLLISDYGLGVLTEAVRRSLLSNFAGKIITVDSRYNLKDYIGVSLITPNISELESAASIEIIDDKSLLRAAQTVQKQVKSKILVTRGPQGMSLLDLDGTITHLPVFGLDQPVDPTGAGDTVASAITLALAAGANFTLAASLAAVAAGITVMKKGTATVHSDEMLKVLKSMGH